MCGIFGLSVSTSTGSEDFFSSLLKDLFLLSESRGKEASGLVFNNGKKIQYAKTPFPASDFVRTKSYKDSVSGLIREKSDFMAAIGHSRLVTNGYEHENQNNQPVIKGGVLAVHNGIVVNHENLWENVPHYNRETELDSEIIPTLIDHALNNGCDLQQSIIDLFASVKGMTSTAMLFRHLDVLALATNNGSIYQVSSLDKTIQVFASERHILNQLIDRHPRSGLNKEDISQLLPNSLSCINLRTQEAWNSFFNKSRTEEPKVEVQSHVPLLLDEIVINIQKPVTTNQSMERKLQPVNKLFLQAATDRFDKISSLKRCSRCILPETFPFISFNSEGVCNYCNNHAPLQLKGPDKFRSMMESYKEKGSGLHDCLMPFSGGRDSSFALHYVKKELGMNPLAFSYDWGMLTDLARRNQARMCGELGVEHILISADIRRKRQNIRKNVLAWLKRPHLGTIPLFMAGDKQYFYYTNLLLKQNKIELSIMGENMLETTRFKTGFCGISPHFGAQNTYSLTTSDKFKMLAFYGKEFLLNPAYINTSLFDTMNAFQSYYVMSHTNVNIFDYLPWNENQIEDVLLNQYDWETDPETDTTWRIGDGTAAFYNYIYFMVAGFTENDTFRSNQIREGQITREVALELANRDNQPRWGSIQWYCNVIGIDWQNALNRINRIPTLN